MNATLNVAAATTAVTTADSLPPTSPATTIGTTSTKAGEARLMSSRTGTMATPSTSTPTTPTTTPAAARRDGHLNIRFFRLIHASDAVSTPVFCGARLQSDRAHHGQAHPGRSPAVVGGGRSPTAAQDDRAGHLLLRPHLLHRLCDRGD